MSDDTRTLSAELRDRTGSRYAKRIRSEGKLPAIVYGHGETPQPVTLDHKEAMTHFSKGEKVFSLELGGKTEHVLLKDLGYDHLGNNIIHADFARVNLDERVDTRAHLHFVGNAVGLKKAGAVLMKPLSELELNCVVTNLPDAIEVDLSDLDVGDAIHAGEIKLPKSTMKLLTDPDAVVAQIVVQAEEEETGEGAEVAADGSEPEVIGGKKDDDAEGDAEKKGD
ncbi:MAG: 50S ribosomal protein L25 [Phycisphaeraceae bacterium]|nr:MAG: 50S ribosomal protein L25 [Phycisphaeraceae bacterium]